MSAVTKSAWTRDIADTQKMLAAWEATPAYTNEDRLTRDAHLKFYRDRALRLAEATVAQGAPT